MHTIIFTAKLDCNLRRGIVTPAEGFPQACFGLTTPRTRLRGWGKTP
ncbi:MAG TPA: hypothetical protein VGC21_23810 [Telluria sp.]|jgi:hypothetical protein